MVTAMQHYRPRVSQADIIVLEDWSQKASDVAKLANCEHEQALISAVFQESDGYFGVANILQPSDFYSLTNGYVWKAFEDVVNSGHKIDILTVKAAMEKYPNPPLQGDALLRHLTMLYGYAPNALNIEAYAQEVRESALKIRMYKAVDEMKRLLVPEIPTDMLIDKCNQLLFEATEQDKQNDTSMFGMVMRYTDQIEARMQPGAVSRIVPTGIAGLDDLIGGFSPREVTVLAGADKMGKTTLLLSKIRNILKAGGRVLFFSLEMTQDEILRILMTMETGISKKDQKTRALTPEQWGVFLKTAGYMKDWKLDVVDTYPALTPTQLRREIRKHAMQNPVDLVVIDGLWLMHSDNAKLERPAAVNDITQQLTSIAKNEFNLPILITHQYRDGRDLAGKIPNLSWLSESIGVRRNCQMILGMHRPKHFNPDDIDDETGLYVLADRNGQGAQGEYVPLIYDEKFVTYKGAQYVTLE